MKTLRLALVAVSLLGFCFTTGAVQAQDYDRNDDDQGDYNARANDKAAIDRYLDVEVWTDHSDAEYYTGDEVVVHFRANRDAFVAIYSVDSRGMVNLLFPADPAQDNFVLGGNTYSLPGQDDDFEFVLNGPEGTETFQVIASRERFPIPAWHHNSGLVFTGDDIHDYMDYLNDRYFVRYSGQRFAYDRAVIFVNEWEPNYFRPVYYTNYPSWSVVGNVYLDYPYGSTVYVNGYYWGVTPLYIPRILVGWHTMTIYDRYGHCWENDFHVSRYHTTVFDRHVIVTNPSVRSKYKRVRTVGYRDPITNGYSNYKKTVTKFKTRSGGASGSVVVKGKTARAADSKYVASKKRYVRGESKLVKTERGYESRTASSSKGKSGSSRNTGSYSSDKSRSKSSSGRAGSYSSGSSKSSKGSSKSGSYSGSGSSSTKSKSGSSGDYYKRKSGSSSSKAKKSSSKGRYKSSGKSKSSKSSKKSPTVKSSKGSSKKSTSKASQPKVSKSSKSSSSKSSSAKSSSSKRSSSSKSSSSKSSSSSSKGKRKR